MAINDFDIGFTPEQFSGLEANDGGGYKRLPFGDYDLKITDGEIKATTNAKKPHNMIKVTFTVVKAHDEANKGEVGSTIEGLYGTASSPPFMQRRFKNLCNAAKVEQIKRFSQLHGKIISASVVWELSKSDKLDEMGRPKMYVNDRVKAERPLGSPRPKTINPEIDSKPAVTYLEGQGGGDEPAGDVPAWEAGGDMGANAGGVGSDSDDQQNEDAGSGYLDEKDVPDEAHDYRASIILGGDDAAEAKETLISSGIDPDGPIDVEKLTENTKKLYLAKINPPKAKGAALKPLAGGKGGKK